MLGCFLSLLEDLYLCHLSDLLLLELLVAALHQEGDLHLGGVPHLVADLGLAALGLAVPGLAVLGLIVLGLAGGLVLGAKLLVIDLLPTDIGLLVPEASSRTTRLLRPANSVIFLPTNWPG